MTLRRVRDKTPAVPLKLRTNVRHSSGSGNPCALTRRHGEVLLVRDQTFFLPAQKLQVQGLPNGSHHPPSLSRSQPDTPLRQCLYEFSLIEVLYHKSNVLSIIFAGWQEAKGTVLLAAEPGEPSPWLILPDTRPGRWRCQSVLRHAAFRWDRPLSCGNPTSERPEDHRW